MQFYDFELQLTSFVEIYYTVRFKSTLLEKNVLIETMRV